MSTLEIVCFILADYSAQPASMGTLTSIDESPRHLPPNGGIRALPFYHHDLGITDRGATTFDFLEGTLHIMPRIVVKMNWYSERDGNRHEYIVLKVSEKVHHKDVWIRFLPYSSSSNFDCRGLDCVDAIYAEDHVGDFAYIEAAMVPINASVSASLDFENGVHYSDVLATRHKMRKVLHNRNTEVSRLITDPDMHTEVYITD